MPSGIIVREDLTHGFTVFDDPKRTRMIRHRIPKHVVANGVVFPAWTSIPVQHTAGSGVLYR